MTTMLRGKPLSTWNMIKLILKGHVKIGEEQGQELYIAHCPEHSYYYATPQGYKKRLECPHCIHRHILRKKH